MPVGVIVPLPRGAFSRRYSPNISPERPGEDEQQHERAHGAREERQVERRPCEPVLRGARLHGRASSATPCAPRSRKGEWSPCVLLRRGVNSALRSGSATTRTSSCPSSTPMLNPSERRHEMRPGELQRLAQREREAEAVHEAEPERDQPAPLELRARRCSRAPCRRSTSAISTSMSGGNQSALGAKPSADAKSVMECATVNDVTIATAGGSVGTGSPGRR